MYCISCGIQLSDGALFCHKCGAKQTEKPAAARPQGDASAQRRLKRGIAFLDNWLAFVAVAVLAIITTILFAVGSQGFTVWDAAGSIQQFCLVGALGMSALVSTRTGGLDLSAGSIMALSSVLFAMQASANHAGMGFALTLIVCGALGLLNGLFIMVARIPAVFVTVASAMLIRGIAMWASGGVPISLPAGWAGLHAAAAALALLVSVGIAILLLWRTGRFTKRHETLHGKMKFFWIYGLIAMIGVVAGWAAAISSGAADASFGSGSSNEMILLFIFAVISASGLLKNNWFALVWVLLMAVLWTLHDQAMLLLTLNPFSMVVSNASWVFILLGVMSIAKRSWRKPMRVEWGR